MIGDKLDTDIGFGKNSGIDTLLVLSGVTKAENYETLQARHPEFKPTHMFNSVKDLLPS